MASSRVMTSTVCASASATSRASPVNATASVIARLRHQGVQLVLEAAGLDRAVDAALLRRVRLPPPAAGAVGLAGLDRPRARRAPDRGVALVVQLVVGDVELADVLPDLVLRPLGQWVQLH